jgi:Ca-activated chloride channel family protein
VIDAEQPRPREIVFVIDNSGSMGGTSMVQAKASLVFALSRLRPTDRFNVIRFDHTMDVLFPDTVPANAEYVGQAKAFRAGLKAAGGTEMLAAHEGRAHRSARQDGELRAPGRVPDRRRDRQRAATVRHDPRHARALARVHGRHRLGAQQLPDDARRRRSGAAPSPTSGGRAGRRAHARAVREARKPGGHQPHGDVLGHAADVTPSGAPDLYRGEPVVLAAKLTSLSGTLEIQGRIGERPWIVTLPIANAAEGKGLSKLWARRKIADAEVARTLRSITLDEADKRILALALDHSSSRGSPASSRSTRRRAARTARRSRSRNCRSTCRPAGSSRRCSAASARPAR